MTLPVSGVNKAIDRLMSQTMCQTGFGLPLSGYLLGRPTRLETINGPALIDVQFDMPVGHKNLHLIP